MTRHGCRYLEEISLFLLLPFLPSCDFEMCDIGCLDMERNSRESFVLKELSKVRGKGGGQTDR